jgi:pimeloyl-ACP methyl ester carboxylesterase
MKTQEVSRSTRHGLPWIIACGLLTLARVVAADEPSPGKFAQVDDIRVHYLDFGHGSPVVLLHGAFASSSLWQPAGQVLGKCHRVVIPDLRGRGLTPDGEGPMTYGRIARDTVGLMDQLGIRRAHIVGHSAGSITLLAMLVDYPDRVLPATLVSSPAMAVSQTASQPTDPMAMLRADLVNLSEGQAPADPFLAELRDQWLREAPQPERFRIMIGKLLNGVSSSYPPSASVGAVPIMVVRAGRDELIPESAFTALAEVVHARRVVDYPEGTHVLPVEQPAALAANIESFIDKVDPSPCGEPAG